MHEHRADSFSVVIRDAEMSIEPRGKMAMSFPVRAGVVSFAPVTNGPYAHRIVASGSTAVHVVAMELLLARPGGPPNDGRRDGARFSTALENARGRAYRYTIAPGESIRRIHLGASGEGQQLLGRPVFGAVETNNGFLGHLVEPPSPPQWWNEADVAYYTAEFARHAGVALVTGTDGALNTGCSGRTSNPIPDPHCWSSRTAGSWLPGPVRCRAPRSRLS